MKDKRRPFEYNPNIYAHKKCKTCSDNLKLGDFAYHQEMCWNCFYKRVTGIAQRARTPDEAEMIEYLRDTLAEIFGYYKPEGE